MSERSNEDIIRIVNKWQCGPVSHELTCVVDSGHEPLEPDERDGKIVLVCPSCGWVQEKIPEAVLESEKALDFAAALTIESDKRLKRQYARLDVWWTVATMNGIGFVVGGVFWSVAHAFVSLTLSGAASAVYAKLKFRKIDAEFGSRP